MTSPTDSTAKFACTQLASECETMERLLHGLIDSKGNVGEEVHAIRKLSKSLRGGFSLLRMKDSAAEIQAIGRLLSGPRDAVSRLKTWQKLGWNDDAVVAAAVHGLLDQQTHSAARRPPPETIAWCVARVTAARQALTELLPEDLETTLTSGLKKLGKQVRRRCLNMDPRDQEDFHDARKALKAYLGALGFLPDGAAPPEPKMAEIADLLGDENDLTTLSVWLTNHGFTPKFAPSLWKMLKVQRRKLQKQVIADAAALFSA